MNTKKLLSLAVVVTLTMVGTSFGAPRTWSKATGNYDDSMSHRPTASARRTYRSVAPSVVREAPAPEAMATAPSTTRRYSYDAATAHTHTHAHGHCHSGHAVVTPSDSSTTARAPSGARSTRRYSYEPSERTYYAPRSRSSHPNPNTLPKSDPRRYNF